MHKYSWFLFVLSTSLSEEFSRKHHKKHHKHHHGHHSHQNAHAPIDEQSGAWRVSNHSNVVKIPPTPEEYAAVDAINAHNAANSAGEAAKVATQVAAHSVDIHVHAQSALNKAQNVLKEARAGAGGMSVDQKELLNRAEINLAHATDSVTHTVDTVKNRNGNFASERARLEDRLSKLQRQLDEGNSKVDAKHQSVEVLRSENELAAMELEIHDLRADLDQQLQENAAMRRDSEVQATQQELSELEAMVKEVELAEAKHQVKVSEHDELKIELEKLRERIEKMHGKSARDSGTLVYEVPGKRQLPLRMVDDSSDPSSGFSESSDGIAMDNPPEDDSNGTPVAEKGIDIDTAMPYGELEPFGREDTAQELTEDSVRESDEMVDQLERAEVAEEKRAVFRALTRLRGAAITSFDGIARSQTGNIDEYNKLHKWRRTHPLHHLADEESDISKWAFPDNADF